MDPVAILGTFYLVVVIAWLAIAIATAIAASKRGHSALAWLIVGLILGPLALAFALSLIDKRWIAALANADKRN